MSQKTYQITLLPEMSNARGNWRGSRLINTLKWRKQQSPPAEENEADLEREQEAAQTSITSTRARGGTSSAPVARNIIYINGVYVPAPAGGPPPSTGATRKVKNTLVRTAPIPDTTLEQNRIETPAGTGPMPLMSIAVPRPQETMPATGKTQS